MAKTVVTTDDLDGSAGAATIQFAFGGTGYEIDLTKKNTAASEKVLKPYIEAARQTGSPSPRRRGKPGSSSTRRPSNGNTGTRHDLSEVRAWATANGHTVSTRGRIAQDVLDAYDAARA